MDALTSTGTSDGVAAQVPKWLQLAERMSTWAAGYDRAVAYDEELAARVRQLVSGEAGVAEKKMFGGLAFLVGGNMAVGVSGQGGLLVRVDPEESDELVASTSAELMEMRGRSMRGWLRVAAADLDSDAALAEWVDRGTAYARSLPPK